jgi:hypothetical protein
MFIFIYECVRAECTQRENNNRHGTAQKSYQTESYLGLSFQCMADTDRIIEEYILQFSSQHYEDH